jgi:hypothetical protein
MSEGVNPPLYSFKFKRLKFERINKLLEEFNSSSIRKRFKHNRRLSPFSAQWGFIGKFGFKYFYRKNAYP